MLPDEPAVAETAPAAAVTAPAPEPEAPAAEPVAAAEPVEAVVEERPAAAEVAAEPETPAPEPAAEKASLLADAGKKTEEPAKAAEPATEPAVLAEPAEPEPIAYEAFKLPEDIALDDERVAAYTEILGKHRAPQELGQELVELHVAELRNLQERMAQHQRDVWDRTQEGWVDQVRKDREIGGNRINTVLAQCGDVIERYGTPGLRDALTLTGAGNHPEVVRFFYSIAKALTPPKPIPASRPAPVPQSRAQRRYASNGSAAP